MTFSLEQTYHIIIFLWKPFVFYFCSLVNYSGFYLLYCILTFHIFLHFFYLHINFQQMQYFIIGWKLFLLMNKSVIVIFWLKIAWIPLLRLLLKYHHLPCYLDSISALDNSFWLSQKSAQLHNVCFSTNRSVIHFKLS